MHSPAMALFIGHGNPMNALTSNRNSQAWATIAADLPRPRAVLVISAHWLTRGIAVTAMPHPQTLHDFAGFPAALQDEEVLMAVFHAQDDT